MMTTAQVSRIKMPTTVIIQGGPGKGLKASEVLASLKESEVSARCIQQLNATTCRVTLKTTDDKEWLLSNGLIVDHIVTTMTDVKKSNVFIVRIMFAIYDLDQEEDSKHPKSS